MPTIKTLILDFDGTIADTKESIVQTIQATLSDLGIPGADEGWIKNLIGLSLRETFIRAAGLTEGETLDAAIGLYRQKYDRIGLDTIRLFPGVKEVLAELFDGGITIAVASGKGRIALKALLDRLEISGYMTLILGEEDVVRKKPAPDMVLSILEKTGATPAETLVVGDTTYDIAMGQGAGCATCGVTWGNHTKEQLKECDPDYIIDDFFEITKIILPHRP